MKKRNVLLLFSVAAMSLIILAGCAKHTMTTDQLAVQFGDVKVFTEKIGKTTNIGASITVNLINRTTRGMDVAFMEGALIDANTNKALIRFRPIIPDAYGGSLSTITLIPDEKRDIPVVMPLGMEELDTALSPKVLLKLSFQTTKGYRTDAVSSPIVVTQK